MKKITLLLSALLIAGASFAHDGKNACCKDKKQCSKKESKACCHKKSCSENKTASTAKKS